MYYSIESVDNVIEWPSSESNYLIVWFTCLEIARQAKRTLLINCHDQEWFLKNLIWTKHIVLNSYFGLKLYYYDFFVMNLDFIIPYLLLFSNKP